MKGVNMWHKMILLIVLYCSLINGQTDSKSICKLQIIDKSICSLFDQYISEEKLLTANKAGEVILIKIERTKENNEFLLAWTTKKSILSHSKVNALPSLSYLKYKNYDVLLVGDSLCGFFKKLNSTKTITYINTHNDKKINKNISEGLVEIPDVFEPMVSRYKMDKGMFVFLNASRFDPFKE